MSWSNSPFLAPSRNESHSSLVNRTVPASGDLLLRTSIKPADRRACTQLPPLPVDLLDIIQPVSLSISHSSAEARNGA